MKQHLVVVAGLLVTLGLPACAATLPTIDTAHATEVVAGVHDRAQVVAWFGPPDDAQHLRVARGACTDVAYWSHATRATYENLTVAFDAHGVVCASDYSGPNRPRATLHHGAFVPVASAPRLARN